MSVARERSSATGTPEPGPRYNVNEAGAKELVVIPVDVYQRLPDVWQDLEDTHGYDEVKAFRWNR